MLFFDDSAYFRLGCSGAWRCVTAQNMLILSNNAVQTSKPPKYLYLSGSALDTVRTEIFWNSTMPLSLQSNFTPATIDSKIYPARSLETRYE